MSSRLRITLRSIAVLIAIAGMIDPGWSAARSAAPEVVVIDLTSGTGEVVMTALEASVAGRAVKRRRGTGAVLPCRPEEHCVLVADGTVDAAIPGDLRLPVSLVAVHPAGSPNVSLRSASAAPVSAASAGIVAVELSRTGSVSSTDVRILDGNAIVGSATHRWSDSDSASIGVPWWPIDVGARSLTVEAVPAAAEVTATDNRITLGVPVTGELTRVVVFDARTSWNSTFVRRALEDDSRFAVEYRSRLAPSITAGSRGGSLDARTLDSAPAVVIGGPDALTASDVTLLERYVAVRGGSLILLPEQRVSGPASRFFHGAWTEHVVPAPEPIGPLRASEILRVAEAPMAASVLGTSAGLPSIVVTPAGEGQVIISGAMDAWRFRDADGDGFNRFWRSLVADAARAGEALRIDLGASLASTAERVPFTLRHRAFVANSGIDARVSVRCDGGEATPVRAWPAGSIGEWVGEIPAPSGGACDVAVTIDGRTANSSFAVAGRPQRGVDVTLARLERQARATGGVFAHAGEEAAVAGALNARSPESSRTVPVRPMRSAWWIVPFAGCLSAEWWLRRRAGLR